MTRKKKAVRGQKDFLLSLFFVFSASEDCVFFSAGTSFPLVWISAEWPPMVENATTGSGFEVSVSEGEAFSGSGGVEDSFFPSSSSSSGKEMLIAVSGDGDDGCSSVEAIAANGLRSFEAGHSL